MATITPLSAEWNGSESITFTATDPGGLSANDAALFTVTAENDPPVISNIPNQTINEGHTFTEIHLDEFVLDIDNPDNELVWTYTENSELEVSIINRIATILIPDTNWYGSGTVTFTVTDPGNLFDNYDVTFTVNNVNDPPHADNLAISGSNTIGSVINAAFEYSDPENDGEGNHIYQWYISDDDQGNGIPISGATNSAYTLVYGNGGKFISFQVIPVDIHNARGDKQSSGWFYINASPVATNPLISGQIAIDQTVTVFFAYSDIENDPQGVHQYQWYRSNNADGSSPQTIPGATGNIYPITNAELNKYISFSVIPAATTGSPLGQQAQSPWYGPINKLPTATISGTSSVCAGEPAQIIVALTGSNPPWSISYTVDGEKTNTINNIITNQYTFEVTVPGVYELSNVSDSRYASGSVSGQAVITHLALPTVSLTGGGEICNDGISTAALHFSMSGTSPWTLTYTRDDGINGKVDTTVNTNISNYIKNEIRRGHYSVKTLVDNTGCNAVTSGSGSVNIEYKDSPVALISGLDTICQGDPAFLFVEITEGVGPWTFDYSVNGQYVKTKNIPQNQNPYTLSDTLTGTYVLTRIYDAALTCTGKVSGTGSVSSYSKATASISGDATICEHTITNLRVDFGGDPPWDLTYKRSFEGNEEIKTKTGININPYYIPVADPGVYTILALEDENCPGGVSGSATIDTIKSPTVEIIGLDTLYSLDTEFVPFQVLATPSGGTGTFDNSDVYIPIIDGIPNFVPYIAGTENSPHWVRYMYTDPFNGCEGKDSVRIFVFKDVGAIQVENEKSVYCFNDDTITVYGINKDNSIGYFTISGNTGLVNLGNNNALLIPSQIQSGTKNLTYHFSISDIENTVIRPFSFEKIEGNFSWNRECFDSSMAIEFNDQSTGESDLVEYYWNITFPDAVKHYKSSSIFIQFDSLGTYPVDYVVTSDVGCSDTVRKLFVLKPTYPVNDYDYFEDFSDGVSYWIPESDSIPRNIFWNLGAPSGNIFNATNGEKAWYTQITNPLIKEYSYLTSPCFDFSESKKPMLKMNIWRAFTENLDGAVLQYTTDNGDTWHNVGDIEDGINWYNSHNILGLSFNNGIGWTNAQDNNWIECRHVLDELAGYPFVRFRLVYGTSGVNLERDGIAIDNILIGERKKRLLLEHFTNTEDEQSHEANRIIHSLMESLGSDVLNIQYHTSFPENDPFYNHNPIDPSARSLYYGVSEIPFAILDGGINSSERFNFEDSSVPSELDIQLNSLMDPDFTIELISENTGGSINVKATIIPLDTVTNKEITLHIAVIEQEMAGIENAESKEKFENVLKAMLPNAGGTNYFRNWYPGNKETVNYSWQFSNVFDPEQVHVVAFIQDESTKKIYQAVIDSDDTLLSNTETNNIDRNLRIIVFPNPNQGLVNIIFKGQHTGNTKVEIYNPVGTLLYQDQLSKNEELIQLQLDFLQNGIYFIRIVQDNNEVATSKIIVSK
ncbi:MAG: T9SS type A sorting domain-containing protein [Bacteroidales bacterium]|nr:T9SS type A sorting domain-containing protein [Bacteroidales bacterium]